MEEEIKMGERRSGVGYIVKTGGGGIFLREMFFTVRGLGDKRFVESSPLIQGLRADECDTTVRLISGYHFHRQAGNLTTPNHRDQYDACTRNCFDSQSYDEITHRYLFFLLPHYSMASKSRVSLATFSNGPTNRYPPVTLYIHVDQHRLSNTFNLGDDAFEVERLSQYNLEYLLHVY
jgi:hypothetical protein